MKKYFSLAITSVLFLGMFSFSAFAFAADNSVSSTSISVITSADLGVIDVGTLPTSKWYFLKEWRRGIARLFTFDATAKAELELKITNEKATEVLAVKASEQINRATDATAQFELFFDTYEKGGIIIGTKDVDNQAAEKTGPVRLDPTPARISTNLTIDRQTPKRDFGDRMKAGLDQAVGMLANAKTAYAEGKFGEAFGLARSAEVLAASRLRLFTDKNGDGVMGKDEKSVAPPMPNIPMPIVPEKGKVPVVEKKVFPEAKVTCGKIQCFRYDPVCGTDGKTYGCGSADALSCGVKVAYSGECKIAPSVEVKPIKIKTTATEQTSVAPVQESGTVTAY